MVFALVLMAAPVGAQELAREAAHNWHQWRGPLATGVAVEGDPPLRWDAKTNIKWAFPLPGKGSSTPIIWGDQVFVLTAIDTGRKAAAADLPKLDAGFEKKTEGTGTYHQFVILSIDRATGKLRWKQVATEQVPHEGHHPTHSYAAGSPFTDGQRLYLSFGSRGTYCYDLAGKLLWQRDLGRMNTRYGWGEAVTPVTRGDTVIVNWDQEKGSFIVALDARTGEVRWKKERDEVTSWNTPLVVEHAGRTQVIVSGTKRVRGYDLATGEVLWECGGMTINAIPSPVVRDGVAYCMSGYRGAAAFALPLDARGDVTDGDKVLWRYNRDTPYVPSPLLMGDRLYFTSGNNPFLTILDVRTGKPILERQRLPSLETLYASPVGVKDRIYLPGREGATVVFRHADKLEVLAVNRLDDTFDGSPAVVGKQLFLRGEKALYCIEGK
jgi:outer membrane protein assembly factor BamB